jgi:hypothetical protein
VDEGKGEGRALEPAALLLPSNSSIYLLPQFPCLSNKDNNSGSY